MKMTRRILSWVLAIALVVTCGITGLVLPVAAEDATNLFVNGDFEEGATSTWENKSTLILEGVGKDGGWGYYHNRTETDEWAATGHVRYKAALWGKMEAGFTYILSFDYKTSGDTIPQIYFDVVPSTEFGGTLEPGSSGGDWKTMVYTFIPKEDLVPNGGWEFSIRSRGGAGELWYDNLSLVKAPASVEFASETLKANVGEIIALDATFVNSAATDFTWESSVEDVATVENGVITAKAVGETTISATIGDVTKSIVLSVAKDKTLVMEDMHAFTYGAALEGSWNKGDAVKVYTDTDGTEYIHVPNSVTSSININSGKLQSVKAGEWLGISFKARVHNAASNSGSVRATAYVQGVASTYTFMDFYPNSVANAGDGWINYTFWARASVDRNGNSYIQFHRTSGSPAEGYDIAELKTFRRSADEVNLAGYSADFEDGIPRVLGGYDTSGSLMKSTVADIVEDPLNPGSGNMVLKTLANSGTFYVKVEQQIRNDNADGKFTYPNFKPGATYKITYRQLGKTSFGVSSGRSTLLLTEGAPTTKNTDAWKTVTHYAKIPDGGTSNANYTWTMSVDAGTYIDDLAIYEVPNTTGFEIKGDTEMTLGESQTLVVNTIPKHAYPGITSLSVTGDGFTLSGSTLKAAPVSGTTVTGATVTITSDLLDENSNPITATLNIVAKYPEEHFVNGTMDNGSTDGIYFGASPSGLNIGVAGIGVDGTNGLEFTAVGPHYFKSQTYVLRPNSLYAYSVAARSNGTGAKLELIFSAGNNNSGNKVNHTAGLGTNTLSTEWKTYTGYFMTGPTTTYFDTNWSLGLHCRALGTVEGSATAPVYVDNISMKLIETENFVMLNKTHSSSTITISADGGETWSTTVLRDVAPGTVIKVKTWHNYNLTQLPGAFKFITNTGVSTPILSPNVTAGSTAETFGKYAGDICEFVMPEVNNGLVYAPIANTSSLGGDFAMDTVATSLRKTATEGKYDGIRFLTRLALDKTFDPDAETLTVTYGDVEYTVVEFGSLLKRSSNELELTVENYDAQDGSAAQRMWKSAAYEAGNPMKLLDYTSTKSTNCTNYIDFASVMTMGEGMDPEAFAAREYTARGYMILRPAEGEDVVVYSTNTQTDSVNSAAARLP